MSDAVDTHQEEATVTTGQTPAVETFSLEYVQQLRGEAAKYRSEKKSAVDAAKTEVSNEFNAKLDTERGKYSELQGKLGAAEVELTKLRVALELGVPSDKVLQFAAILQGTDEEALKASGESAKELFGGFKTLDAPTDSTQGSGNGVIPLNGDPILNAIKRAVGAS